MTEEKKAPESFEADPVEPVRTIKLTDAQQKARNQRNLMIAGALLAFVVLVFFVTMARLQSNLQKRNESESGLSEPVLSSVDV